MTFPLKLGIPKGSLEEATIALFEKAGWKILKHTRNYFPDINDAELSAKLCRVQEIPDYIQNGILDVAIAGKDWLMERNVPFGGPDDPNASIVLVSDLVYSKVSSRKARWVLAVAGDSPYRNPEDLRGKRISTELVEVSRRYFASKGIEVSAVNFSWGATEAKVVEGLADAIVEVTETETTIRAHGLRVIDEVLSSNAVLIATREAWNNPESRRKIEQLDLLLQGALRAEHLVCLKMNAPADKLNDILALLPALNSPTVAQLRDSSWLSLETVVDVHTVRDLIPQLHALGAEGILELSLNKVV